MFITDILLNSVRKVYALGKKKHNKTKRKAPFAVRNEKQTVFLCKL